MDYSVTFARHFSRLVWLLLHEPGNVDEQKAALRAITTISKDGPISFALQEWRLVVNGALLPEALLGVQDLVAQLIGHAVVELAAAQGAAPADMLGVARLLAAEPVPGDGGHSIARKLQALGVSTVSLRVRAEFEPGADAPAPAAQSDTPPAERGKVKPAAAPKRGGAKESAAKGSAAKAAPDAPGSRKLSNAAPAQVARASGAHRAVHNGERPTRERTARAEQTGPRIDTRAALGITTDTQSGRYLAFAVQQPRGSAREILTQLDATKSVNVATRLLDELVTLAESSAREGVTSIVADALCGVVEREEKYDDGEMRRAYTMAIRRMSKPVLLRMVAMYLPRTRERRAEYMLVLSRTGEEGADALIDQLTAAQSLADRRVYFDALLELKAGVSALIHMLGDARWYVARNAADLLGDMQAADADLPLIELLKHDDERVRRAATTALAKLATPKSHQALRGALKDSSPQVRMQAVAGLGSRKQAMKAVTLIEALDEESDGEVQFAILAALGRLATADAIKRLSEIAGSEGRIFRRRPLTYRIAAINALGDAGTPEAMVTLHQLIHDKEKELREAAVKAITAAQRSSLAASA